MEAIECGVDLCLVLFRWTSAATLPDGRADGRWLLILDNSYGARRIP
jgi:hypothetical protein